MSEFVGIFGIGRNSWEFLGIPKNSLNYDRFQLPVALYSQYKSPIPARSIQIPEGYSDYNRENIRSYRSPCSRQQKIKVTEKEDFSFGIVGIFWNLLGFDGIPRIWLGFSFPKFYIRYRKLLYLPEFRLSNILIPHPTEKSVELILKNICRLIVSKLTHREIPH